MSTTTEPAAGPAGDPTTALPEEGGELVLSTDDLVAIASDVWACFLEEEVYPVADAAVPSSDGGGDSVLASVGISGTWGGQVLLEMPLEGARAAARRMMQADEVSPSDVVDALGELSNMIGGNVKSLAPPPSHLGLPTVVLAAGTAPADPHPGVEIHRADLGWADGHTVRISVRATHDPRTSE